MRGWGLAWLPQASPSRQRRAAFGIRGGRQEAARTKRSIGRDNLMRMPTTAAGQPLPAGRGWRAWVTARPRRLAALLLWLKALLLWLKALLLWLKALPLWLKALP